MTKADEIALIDKIIRDHADDSYIGPFLKEHRSTIVEAIKSDIPITVQLYITSKGPL